MIGKEVRIVGRHSWEGHHGTVLSYVPQHTQVVKMLLRVKLKNGVIVHCLRETLRNAEPGNKKVYKNRETN